MAKNMTFSKEILIVLMFLGISEVQIPQNNVFGTLVAFSDVKKSRQKEKTKNK